MSNIPHADTVTLDIDVIIGNKNILHVVNAESATSKAKNFVIGQPNILMLYSLACNTMYTKSIEAISIIAITE